MKLSKVKALKPGDRVQLKASRDKFSNYLDKRDAYLVPGKVIVVDEIDLGPHTNLQILGHYEGTKEKTLWVNHKSVKEYKDELPGSE